MDHKTEENAMSQANYISEHHFSENQSMDFVLQQLVKINQKAGDPRLFKLQSLIKSEESFGENWIKIFIAILTDLSPEKYADDIEKLAYLHEKEVQKDEIQMFVSILLCEIEARKELILNNFNHLKVPPKIVSKKETPNNSVKTLDNSIDIEEVYTTISRSKRKQKNTKQVFILHKKDSDLGRSRPRKSGISSRQKIVSVLEKHQSFLIYQEAFPLPSGIKRIRIKENFEQIIDFIEEYIAQTNLPVEVVIEQDRAKVLLKDKKRQQKKEKHKTQIRIYAA